jgi:isocitrate/isopropylmalate dehydrogenase
VGYEIALAEDDEKNVIARQYAPSTGTAPDITDASQINPAGALLGVAASIENDDKAPQVLKDTLKTVQSNIFKVLKQTSNGNYK